MGILTYNKVNTKLLNKGFNAMHPTKFPWLGLSNFVYRNFASLGSQFVVFCLTWLQSFSAVGGGSG